MFLVYDVFFVFITPLFTKNNESVMVKAATGGDNSGGESLPFLLAMPRFNAPPCTGYGGCPGYMGTVPWPIFFSPPLQRHVDAWLWRRHSAVAARRLHARF